MSLVKIHETLDIAEALVLRSALEASGIRVTLPGFEHAQQNWLGMLALASIPVLVDEADAVLARTILREAEAKR